MIHYWFWWCTPEAHQCTSPSNTIYSEKSQLVVLNIFLATNHANDHFCTQIAAVLAVRKLTIHEARKLLYLRLSSWSSQEFTKFAFWRKIRLLWVWALSNILCFYIYFLYERVNESRMDVFNRLARQGDVGIFVLLTRTMLYKWERF